MIEDYTHDYDLIEFWREHLPRGEVVKLPRFIKGKPTEYLLAMPDDVVLFDAITISRDHLDNMTNKEVVEFIQAQTHTIN